MTVLSQVLPGHSGKAVDYDLSMSISPPSSPEGCNTHNVVVPLPSNRKRGNESLEELGAKRPRFEFNLACKSGRGFDHSCVSPINVHP